MATLKIQLTKPIVSAKFGVTFPTNINLNYFVDIEKRLFVEHPVMKNVYIRVKRGQYKAS